MDRNQDSLSFTSPFFRCCKCMAASASNGRSSNTLKGIIAGAITGGLEICITFPTEYIKTQLQLDEQLGTQKRYTGPWDCIKVTVREHGVRGLYRGLSVLLCGSVPKSAVRFGSFEELKKRLASCDGVLNPQKRLLCGLGGLGHHVVMTVGKNYLGKGHHFFLDNFFTSVTLADELLAQKMHSCGTIRMNRKGWPDDLKVSKSGKGKNGQKMMRGEVKFQQKGSMVATLWQDKCTIAILSTNVDPVLGKALRQTGRGAGIMEAILIVTPMETVKVKFINDQTSARPHYQGFSHGIGQIIKEQGLHGVYQGLVPTIMKQGSNQAIRFFIMETMKEWYRGDDKNKRIPTLLTGLFGATAGAASVFGNTPIDVVKTRLQGLDAHKYKGTIDCAVKVFKNEGPRAFYKGTLPRLSRVMLDVAITFMIYDNFMYIFNKVWKT